MDKQIKAEDKVNVSDSLNKRPGPVGVVSFYDENGKLIAKTHNMIVDAGIEMIMANILGDGTAFGFSSTESSIFTNYKDAKLKAIIFSYNNSSGGGAAVTTNSMTYSDVSSDTTATTIDLDNSNAIVSFANQSITITTNIRGSTISKFNSFYTTFEYTSDSTTKTELFSRGVVDPIFMKSNESVSMIYTIYF
jgi:hypothetical protein